MESRAPSLVTAGEILSSINVTHGLNFNLNKQEFVRAIRMKNLSNGVLSDIRANLFSTTQDVGLAESRSDLVSRCGTSLKPLSLKLSEDIWELAHCLACNMPVKRVMYIGVGKEVLSI